MIFVLCFQLALTHSPPLSEVFVFTDASPKDAHLFDAVKALALEKQSKVKYQGYSSKTKTMMSSTLHFFLASHEMSFPTVGLDIV